MVSVSVDAGARIHVGFQNLSLARERLYGGLGIGLSEPRVRVVADPAPELSVADPLVESYARRACEVLEVPGVRLSLEADFPRHVGFGSGTQLALAVYTAVAHAHGLEPRVRAHAPALGRGGRSGIGVATFEGGGFVVDAGHPTGRFTTDPPADGDWTVPVVVARHDLPADWRVLLVVPDVDPGRSGEQEDSSMRAVVEKADPSIADDIAGIVTRRLLPAAAEGRLEAFGDALGAIGRKNGAWYADAQGGVFRPPAGELVEALEATPVLTGVGQSSWGPTVYGLTDAAHAEEARETAHDALERRGLAGEVSLTTPARTGAQVAVEGEGHNR
ncbi:beta-ribofuranosylaminobenzene 5'-phosphate synthase family protein [Natronobiforma cellulositropha]|uniref:beta-ribofuranosylaminobenzene 5'-phosphate synthase family protein n=1 Tax=Natronobiforma cellulositropha TaxID=1679076 RepID=UPI0021D5C955|nr:beta-ribofuranosylaminobenzene 5'-phosphate synthase family protein [Natronobiforma cellulositropha]